MPLNCPCNVASPSLAQRILEEMVDRDAHHLTRG